jgi:hypothetical protein
MTIMVAGGLTFAVPGVMPEAMAANANLFVSAENSQYGNIMVGPQVVEVVVIDSDINETNQSNGEPDVTVNGKKLRMAQATDGNWYGYFADKTQATTADQILETNSVDAGYGIDFGQFCGAGSTATSSDETTQMFSDTVGVAFPIRSNGTGFGVNGTSTITNCTTDFNLNAGVNDPGAATQGSVVVANSTHSVASANTVSTGVDGTVSNVVREAKKINTISGLANGIGQIGLKDDGLWPFVQLYDLTTGGNVEIKYAKGGGVQTTTLTFDTYSDVSETLDRTKYPQGGQVFFTIHDPWLDIDPTDEDSWTFDTNTSGGYGIYYQLFNENGADAGDGNNVPNYNSNLSALMAEEGVLKLNRNTQSASTAPVFIQDNDDTVYTACAAGTQSSCATNGGTVAANQQPVTVVETLPSSGVFVTYDESDKSQLKIHSSAIRGTSATITYADGHTILVGNSFATIEINPIDDTWNSGEEIPVVLVDEDQNKNSRSDEDLQVKTYTNATLIPALETGDPFTLGENRTSAGVGNADALFGRFSVDPSTMVLRASDGYTRAVTETVSKYSEIMLLGPQQSVAGINGIVIDYNVKYSDFFDTVKDTRTDATTKLYGTNLVNLDASGFNATGSYDIYLLNNTAQIITASDALASGTGALKIANAVDPKSITAFNQTTGAGGTNSTTTNVMTELFSASDKPSATADYFGVLIVHSASSGQAGWTTFANTVDAKPLAIDFFSFGFTDDGAQSSERVANQVVRIEVEETGENGKEEAEGRKRY